MAVCALSKFKTYHHCRTKNLVAIDFSYLCSSVSLARMRSLQLLTAAAKQACLALHNAMPAVVPSTCSLERRRQVFQHQQSGACLQHPWPCAVHEQTEAEWLTRALAFSNFSLRGRFQNQIKIEIKSKQNKPHHARNSTKHGSDLEKKFSYVLYISTEGT